MTVDSLSWSGLAISAAGLFLGGISKGALGIGLPLLAVPIMAFFMSVPEALAILTVPIFVTNVWQSFQGGNLRAVTQRFWPLAIMLAVGIGIGAQALTLLNEKIFYLIMGLVILLQPALRLTKPGLRISPRTQKYVGPPLALVSGVIGGMTGFFGPLMMVYLATLGLQKDQFTATVSMLFVLASLSLGLFLAHLGLMGSADLTLSAFALLPAIIGIYLGQKIRSRISHKQFEKSLTVAFLFIGIGLLSKAL